MKHHNTRFGFLAAAVSGLYFQTSDTMVVSAEAVKLLLEAGADSEAKNRLGDTQREVAESKGHKEIAEILRRAVE